MIAHIVKHMRESTKGFNKLGQTFDEYIIASLLSTNSWKCRSNMRLKVYLVLSGQWWRGNGKIQY